MANHNLISLRTVCSKIKYKERGSAAHIGGHSFLKSSFSEAVGESASGEEVISKRKKKKRKKEKDDSKKVGEHINEPLSEPLSGSPHLAEDKERLSGVGVSECSVVSSSVSEPVGDSASGDVICEEGISKRKTKKIKKKDDSENVEEPINEPPSKTFSDIFHLVQDKERNSGVGGW